MTASGPAVRRRRAVAALAACVAPLGGASVLAALADRSWLADLFVHFRPQYAALALLAMLAAGLLRHRVLLLAAALVLVVNLPGAARELLPGRNEPRQPALRAATLSVPGRPMASVTVPVTAAVVTQLELISANLWFRNAEHGRVVAWLAREAADVVFLMEVTGEWRQALEALAPHYPHRHHATGARGRGVMVLSRWPLSDPVLPDPGRGEGRAMFVTVTRDGAPLRLALMHASWPFGPELSRARGGDLEALAGEARAAAGRPLVVLGDLNVTAQSPHFRRLLSGGALRDAGAGRGWQPTWPVGFPLLGIRIDHALVNAGVRVREYRRGPAIGSDHWPLKVGIEYGI